MNVNAKKTFGLGMDYVSWMIIANYTQMRTMVLEYLAI